MLDFGALAATIRPVDEPTCCPDAFLCVSSIDAPTIVCPRHTTSGICCDSEPTHLTQDRASWHRQMEDWERALLDAHIRDHESDGILLRAADPDMLAALGAAIPSVN